MRSIIRTSALLAALVAAPVLVAVGAQEAAAAPAAVTSVAPDPAPVADNSLWPLVDVTDQYYLSGLVRLLAPLVGDNNADGVIDEDESGFNCRTMGNGYCGL